MKKVKEKLSKKEKKQLNIIIKEKNYLAMCGFYATRMVRTFN